MCNGFLPRALTQEKVTSGNQKDHEEEAHFFQMFSGGKAFSGRNVTVQVRALVEAAVWRGLRG